jgi:hypothetical protein
MNALSSAVIFGATPLDSREGVVGRIGLLHFLCAEIRTASNTVRADQAGTRPRKLKPTDGKFKRLLLGADEFARGCAGFG